MNKLISFAALATLASGSALAACPNIEGKYTYTCTVTKDEAAEFADVLEVSGQMLVNQKACETYVFTNMNTQIQEDFSLTDLDRSDEKRRAKIRKASAKALKFTTIESDRSAGMPLDFTSLYLQITKGSIRTKRKGFVLKGKERSRFLGVFGARHSKFSCRFTEER